MFAMTVLSVMISSFHINDLGKVLFVCVLERISFSVPRFFNVSFGFVKTKFIVHFFCSM